MALAQRRACLSLKAAARPFFRGIFVSLGSHGSPSRNRHMSWGNFFLVGKFASPFLVSRHVERVDGRCK